jgi:hypothetical protein
MPDLLTLLFSRSKSWRHEQPMAIAAATGMARICLAGMARLRVATETVVSGHRAPCPWLLRTAAGAGRRCGIFLGAKRVQLAASVCGQMLDLRGGQPVLANFPHVRHGYPWVPTDQAHGHPRQVGPAHRKTHRPDSGPNKPDLWPRRPSKRFLQAIIRYKTWSARQDVGYASR